MKTTSTLVVVSTIATLSVATAATSNRTGGAINGFMPHLVNSTVSTIAGVSQQDLDTPHISLKVMPSKRIHISPSEMNALLFTIKQEIHRKVNQLEDDLIEHRHENEKHLSAWALNQAPVYMPFRDNPEGTKNKHESSLELEVQKNKQKAEDRNSSGKPQELETKDTTKPNEKPA
ncbi:putative integral membrane protein [Babesia bovis T2Bo]|uniref:putative integral membrane protein n=1 Tax=Babesia bovis T2Bo TaxID=484906 RepID=UPI001C352308|nr:putative integral membrane protein [Babesia bovis T2Bo]EDO06232.2 putative integral membrane protein [Babesia bovis T2Bo]